MPKSQVILRRRTLALGFLAAVASVAVLLVLQWTWLQRLRDMTTLAHRAALESSVRAIGTEVEYYWRSVAEVCLDVPAKLFAEPETDFAEYWAKRPRDGIRRLFAVDYTGARFGRFFMYEEGLPELIPVLTTEEGLAIVVAVSPVQMLHVGSRPQETNEVLVTERDLDHRIMMQPVLGADRRIVGAAGMVLDENFMRERLLPKVVRRTLEEQFPGYAADDIVAVVRDGNGDVVFATGEVPAHPGPDDMEPTHAAFPLVFSDWTISLASPGMGPEKWARAGFAFNMTVAVLLALALLGGMGFALRAANRTMHLSELKSEFVSNVSHELRTPLASIRTFAELLRLGRATSAEKVQEYGEHIESESRRLTRLVDNILDFSRIESGAKEYRFEPGDLEEVARATIASFEMRLKDSGFVFQWVPPSDPLPALEMDEAAVGQVLYNLVDNAVKYSGDSRRVRVSVREEDGRAVCAVRDWGVGIPKKEQKRIFERFHRVGSALVHDVKGSGLGLAIAQHVARAHGGDLVVESEPGEGTRISLRIPLEGSHPPGEPDDRQAGR